MQSVGSRYANMAIQNIEGYEYETGREQNVPRILPERENDKSRRETAVGPRTPSGSDGGSERRRRSPRRTTRSRDSERYRSRTPEYRRRYYEEFRPQRYEPDYYRPWNYRPYYSDWRTRGFPPWRGYGGPSFGGRRRWYGFERKPSRFYQPRYTVRYEPREWFEDGFEYDRMRRHRSRDDHDRRSRRHSERRHQRRSEDKRSDVTSSRTVPADYTKEDIQSPETTNTNNNYTEMYA